MIRVIDKFYYIEPYTVSFEVCNEVKHMHADNTGKISILSG